jgi:hypothetical protein
VYWPYALVFAVLIGISVLNEVKKQQGAKSAGALRVVLLAIATIIAAGVLFIFCALFMFLRVG